MKKVAAIAVMAVFGLISCKKNYTCECTIVASGETTYGMLTFNDTKKNATAECDSLNQTTDFGNGQVSTTVCSIQ
ncbi:MAG: hypothetical protein ACI837_000382 [Crocinitomicaceae bacterium]|jgi:hypothetical protein